MTSRWSHLYVPERLLDSPCTETAGEPNFDPPSRLRSDRAAEVDRKTLLRTAVAGYIGAILGIPA